MASYIMEISRDPKGGTEDPGDHWQTCMKSVQASRECLETMHERQRRLK